MSCRATVSCECVATHDVVTIRTAARALPCPVSLLSLERGRGGVRRFQLSPSFLSSEPQQARTWSCVQGRCTMAAAVDIAAMQAAIQGLQVRWLQYSLSAEQRRSEQLEMQVESLVEVRKREKLEKLLLPLASTMMVTAAWLPVSTAFAAWKESHGPQAASALLKLLLCAAGGLTGGLFVGTQFNRRKEKSVKQAITAKVDDFIAHLEGGGGGGGGGGADPSSLSAGVCELLQQAVAQRADLGSYLILRNDAIKQAIAESGETRRGQYRVVACVGVGMLAGGALFSWLSKQDSSCSVIPAAAKPPTTEPKLPDWYRRAQARRQINQSIEFYEQQQQQQQQLLIKHYEQQRQQQ